MTLAARRSAALRERFVMRLGCVLVSLAVLASLVLEPPRAKAFAVTSGAITALAGGFLAACGLAPLVSGMGNTDEVNESMARLIRDYLTAKRPGVDILHWLGDIKLQLTAGNKLLIPALAVGELTIFAKWVAEKYGTKPGENVVYNDSSLSTKLADGSVFFVSIIDGESLICRGSLVTGPLIFESGWYLALNASHRNDYHFYDSGGVDRGHGGLTSSSSFYLSFDVSTQNLHISTISDDGRVSRFGFLAGHVALDFLGTFESSDSVFGVDVSDTMQQVLDRLTTLEEGQSVALDVGATSSMEIQEILQGILDAILAGDLAASAEIVDTAEVPVDPPPEEETPDIEGLGLPALGAALITRFPFSIPWDIYKGVSLLAAPPKAPYFEVDFLEPIAYRVGGWRGNTTIVLDFSEYEVIGQICRWTSTIGFCLFLASATKRLIWTA